MSLLTTVPLAIVTILSRKIRQLESSKADDTERLDQSMALRAESRDFCVLIMASGLKSNATNIVIWTAWKLAEKLVELEKTLMEKSPALIGRVYRHGEIEFQAGVDDKISDLVQSTLKLKR